MTEARKVSCKEHPVTINYKKGISELAYDISKLRYDKLMEFLDLLATNLHIDAVADLEKGRVQLSDSLFLAAGKIIEVNKHIVKAWEISKPYMDVT